MTTWPQDIGEIYNNNNNNNNNNNDDDNIPIFS